MSASPPVALSQGRTIESFPVCFRGERFEVLIGTPVQCRIRGPNDSAETKESLVIDAVILKELCVVSKISEKPVEFPKSSFCAVESATDGAALEGLGFQDQKLDLHKRFLRMPPIARPLHANKK